MNRRLLALMAAVAGLALGAAPAAGATHSHAPPAPRAQGPHAPTAHPAASRPAGPAQGEQFRGRRFVQSLHAVNLSPEQRDRINGLIESTRQANQNADPETRRQNIQRMRAGIWGTLNPDQQQQFRGELNKPEGEVTPNP